MRTDTIALPILTAECGVTHYLEEIKRFPMLESQEEYILPSAGANIATTMQRIGSSPVIYGWLPRSPGVIAATDCRSPR